MIDEYSVSIPRRVERSFLLQDIAHFTTLFHFYPHILPFFRLRASQKRDFTPEMLANATNRGVFKSNF